MTTKNHVTLWQAIEALARQVPFTRQKVETVLLAPLAPAKDPGNEAFEFLAGGPVELKDGVTISSVDLRIKRGQPQHPGFLVLKLGGACITLAEVRSHYATLAITETPRGRSLDEVTAHTATLPWGQLSFTFAERKPECLAGITFQPKSDK